MADREQEVKEYLKVKDWCDKHGHDIVFERDLDGVYRPHVHLSLDGLTESSYGK